MTTRPPDTRPGSRGRAGRRPADARPGTHPYWVEPELVHHQAELGKGPRDNRPPSGPRQPRPPDPRKPDGPAEPKPPKRTAPVAEDRWAGRAAHRETGTGLPCPLALLMLPVLLPLAMVLALLRHRATDQADRPVDDRARDRLGAHERVPEPFANGRVPADEVLARVATKDGAR